MRIGIGYVAAGVLILLATANPGNAQAPQENVRVFRREAGVPGVGGAGTFEFISNEFARIGKIIKNAPYSADEVTETTQTLSDGNRIVRKSTAQFYRASQGRTRNDRTLDASGPWAAGGDAPQITVIHDPVAGVNYVLNPRDRVARKLSLINAGGKAELESAAMLKAISKLKDGAVSSGGQITYKSKMEPADRKTESLGKQTIEGIEAEGSRTTITIAAGQIGNERPIEIVEERWLSPELQTVVMSRHTDPRFGETVFHLTNIRRGDPPPAFFDVPPEYTVKEDKAGVRAVQK